MCSKTTHYPGLNYNVTDHLEYASVISNFYCSHQKKSAHLFFKFYLNLAKATYNYLIYGSEILWKKHFTVEEYWGELSWYFRQRLVIPIRSFPTAYGSHSNPSPSHNDESYFTTLLRPSTAQRDAAPDARTKEKKMLSWGKGVHNRLNCRIVISKPS